MLTPIWWAVIKLFRSRGSLEAEILTLRHQLIALRRKSPKQCKRIWAGPDRSGGFLLRRFYPYPGQECVDAAVWPIGGDFLHDVDDIGERFDAVKRAGSI
jgi:hypothetical protein